MALANSYSKQPLATDASSVVSKAAVKSRTNSTALQYQRAQVETASPTRLIIMLYEGAIRFCQVALDAMTANDLPAQHENLLKAQCIIAELLGSLNREKGGEVAENLARLYPLMLKQLYDANIESNPEPVKFVQSMLRELLPSWVEVERLTAEEEKRRRGEEEPVSPIANRQSSIATPPRLGNLNA